MKKLTIIVLVLISTLSWAQDTLVDPLLNIKSFSTFEIGMFTHFPNVENVEFGDYILPQGVYSPTIHSAIFWHKVIIVKNEPIYKTKVGLLFNSNYTSLSNNKGEKFYSSQAEMALSFLFEEHMPVNYNAINDKFFKAVDFGFGMYIGTPWYESFATEEKRYAYEGEYFAFNYIKFGLIAEIEFSMINKNGYGHRIGIRSMIDLNQIWKFENTESGVYPTYTSIGIYYNFLTTTRNIKKEK